MAGKVVPLLEQTAEVMRTLLSALEETQRSLRDMSQALPPALAYVRGILTAIEQTHTDTRNLEEEVVNLDAEPSFGLMEDNDDQTGGSFF